MFEFGATAAAIAVVDGSRTATAYLGTTAADTTRPFSASTRFEVGSVSKVFAGLLLADAVRRGEVQLSDPVNRYLPAGCKAHSQGGLPVTLLDAATHAADFAMMPSNWKPGPPGHPHYSLDQLCAFLAGHRSAERPGRAYHYSNVGATLIGLALSRRDKKPYRELLRERIYAPLGMRHSGYGDVPPPDDDRLAGYRAPGKAAELWEKDRSVIGPCCIVQTTVDDMATFMRAAVTPSSPLASAFALLAEPRHRIADGGATWSTLGWMWKPRNGELRKDGLIDGKLFLVAIIPRRRQGLFLAYNTEGHWERLRGIFDHLENDLFGRRLVLDPAAHADAVVSSLADNATHTAIQLGHGVHIEGWRAPRSVHPGDVVHITLYLRVGRALQHDWAIFVRGDAAKHHDDPLRGDHFPSHGRDSTLFWKPGELVADSFELFVPKRYADRSFRVSLGLYDESTGANRVKGPQIRVAPRQRTVRGRPGSGGARRK